MQKNQIILGAAVFVLIVGFLGYQYFSGTAQEPVGTGSEETTQMPDGTHLITLTEDGFVPDEITIKQGETITFKTTTGSMFWPASNLHPSHLIYPEFDPMEPVQPDSTWSYTFEKVGEWKFHDHLAPYFTGVITVTE